MSEVRPGMRIGLGTGSTATHFVDLLGAWVGQGHECIGVATSEQTARQARSLGIALGDLETLATLDLTVDGTDEIDRDLCLIKGGGGALLGEKIVAAASRRMVVIADHTKLVKDLGAFKLPIEVNRFGLRVTRSALARILHRARADGVAEPPAGEAVLSLRTTLERQTFVTDGGHYIVDACFGRILDARALSTALLDVPGVVQHGLFLNLCHAAYIAGPDGVSKLGA